MTVEIQLPDSLLHFVEAEAEAGGYDTPSAYVEDLVVREAQRRKALRRLEEQVREGLESGAPVEVTPEWWARKRAELSAGFSAPARPEAAPDALAPAR
jgi:antitoxin ParD1/3/4